MVWQDISIAPTDGTDVLLYRDGCPPVVAGVFHGEWQNWDTGTEISGEPTHWMPIPPDPKD